MATKNEVAKKEELTVAARPSFMKGQGRGSENVGVEDITIPRLELVQSLSPQRKKTDPQYIEGAEEGMFFNSVSKQLYGESVIFVPVFFRKEYIIWKDRKHGGGFFGAYATEQEAYKAIEDQDLNPEIHEVVDTAQHFGLIVNDPTPDNPKVEEIVISMNKSKMKVNRQLNTMIRMAGGDRFERAYKISSVVDANKAGEEYMNLSVKQLGFVSEPIYRAAEQVYEAISSGAKDVNRDAE